jgi:hypothetical protein
MVEIITYSLKDEKKHSTDYYRDISEFADEVLNEIEQGAAEFITAYQDYIREHQVDALRSFAEYALEFLTIGVLWQVHGNTALNLMEVPQRILASLGKWRKRYTILKPAIDFWRGILGTIYLSPKNGQPGTTPKISLGNLDQLLEWMVAVGDFNEEVKRMTLWRGFLTDQKPQKLAVTLETATHLAAWFEHRSMQILGQYTQNVDQFLAEKHPSYRWREDVIFCGRQRVEYHLYMIGSEILNRAFRERFLQTDRKIVILPPCMKAKLSGCEATETPLGERCAACTPSCHVHQATKLGEKYGFDVFIMPHELSVFSNGGLKPSSEQQIGIVGVSCPLTNMTGGWETKDLGVPAQGLLLDYCGCPWHWHDEGIATNINLEQLLIVLDTDKT